jgi:DNA-directed RNA polymerase subunit RPC12/RpoP
MGLNYSDIKKAAEQVEGRPDVPGTWLFPREKAAKDFAETIVELSGDDYSLSVLLTSGGRGPKLLGWWEVILTAKLLDFVCEKCGERRFEEVMVDVVVTSDVSHVNSEGYIDYGNQTNDAGNVECYVCSNCGTDLVHEEIKITDGETLAKYLKTLKCNEPKPPPTLDDVRDTLRKNPTQFIHAIKMYREITGEGLRESKKAVEAIIEELER